MEFESKGIGKIKFFVFAAVFVVVFSCCAIFSFAASYYVGDVDLDGKITSTDARMILRAAVGKTELSSAALTCADYNRDGKVTTEDARFCMVSALTGGNMFVANTSESTRAVWVATAAGDFPAYDNLNADKLKAEIDKIVETTAKNGLNTIFFQVRPYSDSFYDSSIFPTSTILVENQGDPAPLDCLEYFIQAAHDKNISLHAWINPYRISSSSHSVSALAESNPAVLHPDWVVKHFSEDGTTPAGLWYDPGLPQVRELIVSGVEEILENYDVDGIHFDDYFYPYENASGFEDAETYKEYGNGMSIDDWRRENVNLLVKEVYETVKEKASEAVFGISPFGIWAKKDSSMPEGTDGIGWTLQSYFDIYADSRTWIVNNWVDYICPQVYWEIAHEKAPFKAVVDWWDELCGEYGVELYIGIAAYKGADSPDSAFGDSKEILRQIEYLNEKQSVNGASFFSYKDIETNAANITETLKNVYEEYITVSEPDFPSSMPAYEVNTDNAELMERTGNSDEYGPTEYCFAPLGMRESVIGTVIADNAASPPVKTEYAILSNGLYIRRDQLTYLGGELYRPTVVSSPYFTETEESTEFVISCSQNVSSTVWQGDYEAVITLYGVYDPDEIKAPSLISDKLFAAVKVESDGESTLKIILTYKTRYYIFGYTSRYENGTFRVTFKNPVSLSPDPDKPLSGIKISLDPGHSMRGGATATYNGKKYYEEDWNLELARMVKTRLENLGATVKLSHNGEWAKTLDQLIPEIIEWGPDINISIHFNSASSTSARGTTVWWCYRNSALLADTLVDGFTDGTGLRNGGAPMGMYKVSRFCYFPSVLFETLFMSNSSDVGWYLSSGNKALSADSITDAVVEYFRLQS